MRSHMKKILFADNFNFKSKNFPGFFQELSKYEVKIVYDDKYTDIKRASGDIIDFDIATYENVLVTYPLNKEQVQYLIEDEMNYMIASTDDSLQSEVDINFYSYSYNKIKKIAENRAIFWYSYWHQVKDFDIGVVFGGNTIYSKALMMLCKSRNIPCYVMEHSFTGNDYFFLMQYEAIPNNIKVIEKEIESNWVVSYKNKNNKNVKPTTIKDKIGFNNYILILCQVRNDYSIIAGKNRFKNCALFYRDMVLRLLDGTKDNIVIKCHPYEDKKIKGILTYNYLIDFVNSLDNKYKYRIKIVKDFDLDILICDCRVAITLTSQTGLEVLARNKNLITFGDAFYSGKGFTYDLKDLDFLNSEFIDKIPKFVDFDIYNIYYKYMSNYFYLTYSNETIEFGVAELKLNKKDLMLNCKVDSIVEKTNVKSANLIKLNGDDKISKLAQDTIKKISKKRIARLSRKFIKDPKVFLLDSQYPVLRKMSKFFK